MRSSFGEAASAPDNTSFCFVLFYISKLSVDLLLGSSGVSKTYYQFLAGKRGEIWETQTDTAVGAELLFSTRLLDHLAQLGLAMYIYASPYCEQLEVVHMVCCKHQNQSLTL